MPAVENGLFFTMDHMGTPLKNQNFENSFLHAREDLKIGTEPKCHVHHHTQIQKLCV